MKRSVTVERRPPDPAETRRHALETAELNRYADAALIRACEQLPHIKRDVIAGAFMQRCRRLAAYASDDARAQSLLGAAAHQPNPFRPSSPSHSLRAKTFGEVG